MRTLLLWVVVLLFVAGCASNDNAHDMDSMPCHQMPDGSWMGDCENHPEESEKANLHPGFVPGSSSSSPPPVKSTTIVDLSDGAAFNLTAELVTKTINGQVVTLYAYNGQIPGPALRVQQNSTITINFHNHIDWNTTIHWHGLRHDIKNDGVPGVSQPPVQPGESYTYTVHFPDAGIYWYHPHIREDIQQDSGLSGNLLVRSTQQEPNEVHREELLVLDDVLVDGEGLVPFGKHHANYAVMGRYGNVMLTNGQTDYTLQVNKGDIVRFYITNVANVRPYQLSFGGAPMKLVGGDLGHYQNEEMVDSIIISPAERYIVEVHFEQSKEYLILNDNPRSTTILGRVLVNNKLSEKRITFDPVKSYDWVTKDIARFESYFDKELDYEIELTLETSMNHEMVHETQDIEWEDDMGMMNAHMTSEQVRWILKDKKTGKENMDIEMTANVGDVLKIRLWNNPHSDHPMQHPIHLHGQRFLILSVDGKPVANKVWKDTVLVPTGKTVDILVDVTNPGEWMMHCHIAEHLESGMMAMFKVEE